jgi:hypothetical protein
MPLISVRLTAEHARKAKALREDGTEISQLVRAAIDDAYAKRKRPPRTAKEIKAFMEALYAKYPDPPGYKSPGVDTTDRRAMGAYIREKIRARAARQRR